MLAEAVLDTFLAMLVVQLEPVRLNTHFPGGPEERFADSEVERSTDVGIRGCRCQ